jgi:hypothetical protein
MIEGAMRNKLQDNGQAQELSSDARRSLKRFLNNGCKGELTVYSGQQSIYTKPRSKTQLKNSG